MIGKIKNDRQLVQARLDTYSQLQSILENLLNNKQGSQWGLDQFAAINDRFLILKKIDEVEGDTLIKNSDSLPDNNLKEELRRKMLTVKHLTSILQIRIEGGKQLISCELSKILKGKNIKGYKNSEKLLSESHKCIC